MLNVKDIYTPLDDIRPRSMRHPLSLGSVDMTVLNSINLKKSIRSNLPGFLTSGFMLFDDNERLHSTKTTQKHLPILAWEFLNNPLYSLNLAPSDFHLCPAIKRARKLNLRSHKPSKNFVLKRDNHYFQLGFEDFKVVRQMSHGKWYFSGKIK